MQAFSVEHFNHMVKEQLPAADFCGVAVTDIFLDEESQALAMLSDFIGKSVSLQSEPSYSPEQYDIVLM